MNAQLQCERRRREIRIKEKIKMSKIIKSSVNTIFFFFFPLSYYAQPPAVHYNCGVKKYSFDYIVVGYILVFSGVKNNNIAI